jgi:transposase
MREMLNAIFHVPRGDCPWRSPPERFPLRQTTYRWFARFRDDGSWSNLNRHLVMLDRERVGREASPSAAVIGGRSVKTTERVAHATSIVVEIVRKPPDQVGFAVLPRRWVVERFLAWINRSRRVATDFEATVASATAFLHAASACSSAGSRVRREFRLRLYGAATAEPLTSGDGWVQIFGEHQGRGTNGPRFSRGATAALASMSASFCQRFGS